MEAVDHYIYYAREEMKDGKLAAGFVGKAIAHTFTDAHAERVRPLIRDWQRHAETWEPTASDLEPGDYGGYGSRAEVYRGDAKFLRTHELPAFYRAWGRA